jgi:lysophospholipase L1-like esterase
VTRSVRAVRTGLAAALLCVLLAVAGCTSTPQPAPTSSTAAGPVSFLSSVKTLAALGDSITAGVNACGKQSTCAEASWVTGSMPAVKSVALRIGGLSGNSPVVYNFAKSGAKASQLGDQVTQAVAEKPQLITIMIGANDICRSSVGAMTSVDAFTTSLSGALDTITKDLPDTHVFLVSVPDLPSLVELGASDPVATALWTKSKQCSALLARAGSTATADVERLKTISTRIDGYNKAIQSLCSAHPRCGTDQQAVHADSFTSADISTVDYFHPSAQGQALLASSVWPPLLQFATECATSGGTC